MSVQCTLYSVHTYIDLKHAQSQNSTYGITIGVVIITVGMSTITVGMSDKNM